MRGVESIGAGGDAADLAREAARTLGVVASVTGPVDHVSDGERVVTIANGHPLLATITGTGCMSSAVTGCFLAVAESAARRRRSRRSSRSGSQARTPRASAKGPGSFHVGLYDALAALDPETLDARARVDVRVHALVGDLATARRAVAAGASVVQLRVKAGTAEIVARGGGFRRAGRDVRRQRRRRGRARLGADGVHLGRSRRGRGACAGRGLARSGGRRRRSSEARGGARPTTSASARCGRRRRRRTPTRRSGSTGLARIVARRCRSPWSRSEGSTRRTPDACIGAGAAGVAAIRAATDPALRAAVDEALGASVSSGCSAELERRGLIAGVEHDAAQLGGGIVVTQDALVENVHFRLDWIGVARPRLASGCGQPQRPRGLGRRAAGADRDARGARAGRGSTTWSSCTRASRESRRAGRRRRHDLGGGDRAQRDRDRTVGACARARRRAARRRARRDRAARRGRRRVPRAVATCARRSAWRKGRRARGESARA